MRTILTIAVVATSVLALSACKQNASAGGNSTVAESNTSSTSTTAGSIDGTWKTDLSTLQFDQRPDQLLLKDGQFSCATCTPPLQVAADGAFHPVTGRPYADHISIKVDDDHNVTRTGQKAGKTTSTAKYTVSADGNTLSVAFSDMTGTKPVEVNYTETRVAPAPAGAHAISGSWKQQKPDKISDEGLTATFKADGDTLHMSTPTGQSYDAKLDGSDTPMKGDIGGTVVSVKKNGDSYVETDKIGGKVISVMTMTPGANGEMNVVSEDKRNGSTQKFVMKKQ